MKFALSLIALFICACAYGQPTVTPDVIASGSGEYTSGTLTVCYTVGELVTTFSGSGSVGITQGFNQPEELKPPTTIVRHNVNNNENDIVLYPVPANDQLNIRFHLAEAGLFNVRIEDIAGRTLYTSEWNENNTDSYNQVNTRAFPGGIYFVDIQVRGTTGKTNSYCKQISINH